MKKLIRYIFIPIFAVLMMSHNVFAVDMSPNVHPIWANANPLCSFHHYNSNTWANNAFSNQATTNVTASVDKINCDYPSGLQTLNTYAVYSFRFDNYAYDNSADSGWLASKVRSVSGSANWGVIGQRVSSAGATSYQVDITLYGQASTTSGGTFQIYNPLNEEELFYIKPQERITFLGASYWAVTSESDLEYNYTDVLNAINNKLTDVYNIREILRNDIRPSIWNIEDKLDDIGKDVADNVNDQQKQETQDAADNSQSAGDTSKTQTEGATSNLLSVFGAFANVITNASPTNCVIDAPLNTSFSSDRFHVDLCGLNLPPAIGTLTSIIAVMVVVPFAISMFNKFIGIMESFQK